MNYYHAGRTGVAVTGSSLKQDKVVLNHGKIVNIYIAYELGVSSSSTNDPTLKNCLFSAVTLKKKTQILKNMDILVMELGLIEDQASHSLVLDLVKMY